MLGCNKAGSLVGWKGVGMNFSPSPRRERRLRGGGVWVVKSWKAMVDGLFQNCDTGKVERRRQAARPGGSSTEAAKPKLSINL